MNVQVPFGETHVAAVLPDRTFIVADGGVASGYAAIEDLRGAVDAALAAPRGLPRLRTLVKPGAKVVIAFDDGTVPCFGPWRTIAINAVLDELAAGGVPREAVRLICANALHRKFTLEELEVFLGGELVAEFGERLFCHDAEDAENLVYLGKTAQHGYDVEVSRYVAEADVTVYVNSTHRRGFNGGWKSVCVGLSTFRSIRHHHTPDGMSMSVRNNRMHAVLDEMGAHLESNLPGTIFKIDAIEKNPFEKTHIFAGSVWECRKAVLDILERQYPPRRDLSTQKFDVILYGVPDWSPYAIFSHMNPILTLISSGLGYLGGTVQALGKPGCTLIMATPCPLRWDRVHHASYPDVWDHVLSVSRDAYEIERRFTDHYATHGAFIERYRHGFAFHPVHGILATQPLRRLKQIGKVIVAGIEDPAVARHLGFDAASTVEEALAMAEAVHGKDFSIAYAEHPAGPTKLAM